ncbi:MAG: hypothetical protein ACI8UO_003734 [Verrucomicrobiales bacterium]|jgi:hypothetical protein
MSDRSQQLLGGGFRWWFLPSWLGLDAPCVVSLWLWAIAKSTDVAVPVSAFVALFGSVWAIYLGDRLIDVSRCRDWNLATGRLKFGKRFRIVFAVGLLGSVSTVLCVSAISLPREILIRGLWVGAGVVLYFLVFVVPIAFREKLPGKEIAVGFFFAAGVFSVTNPAVTDLPLLFGFFVVAAFNCLIISARDAESDHANDPGGASRWWRSMDRDLNYLGLLLMLGIATLFLWNPDQLPLLIALEAALLALFFLHRSAKRLTADAVRAVADFCLLTPIVISPWL